MAMTDWAGPGEALGCRIAELSRSTLAAYREQPKLVREHANQESDTAQGGYQHRQLFELVQNSADALLPVSAVGAEAADTSPAQGGRAMSGPGTSRPLRSSDPPKCPG